MQGLLAADIIASLTRMWLASGTRFAQNLFRLIRILSLHYEGPPIQVGGRAQHRNKDEGLVYLVRLGMSMLRKLSEKSAGPG